MKKKTFDSHKDDEGGDTTQEFREKNFCGWVRKYRTCGDGHGGGSMRFFSMDLLSSCMRPSQSSWTLQSLSGVSNSHVNQNYDIHEVESLKVQGCSKLPCT